MPHSSELLLLDNIKLENTEVPILMFVFSLIPPFLIFFFRLKTLKQLDSNLTLF